MLQRSGGLPGIWKICIAAATYSVLLLLHAWNLGLHRSDSFDGYWQKPNWSLGVFFWPPLCLLVLATWEQLEDSWRELFRNGCVRSAEGDDSGTKKTHSEYYTAFADRTLAPARGRVVICAAVSALALNGVDTINLWRIYNSTHQGVDQRGVEAPSAPRIPRHLEATLETHAHAGRFGLEWSETATEIQVDAIRLEGDWTEAWYHGNESENKVGKGVNLSFVLLAYLQQFGIAWLALLSLFQVCLQTYFFARFESLEGARSLGLKLRLDPQSNLHEFGLESWNWALNNFYWILSVALVIPLLSRASQSPGFRDPGQQILQIAVPILVLLPMIATIVSRQWRMRDLWEEVQGFVNKDQIDLYHSQRVWPLDRNWASKLGILIAFAMLSLLIGVGLSKLVDF